MNGTEIRIRLALQSDRKAQETLARRLKKTISEMVNLSPDYVQIDFPVISYENRDGVWQNAEFETVSGTKSKEPYEAKMLLKSPKLVRKRLEARFVAVSDSRRENRGSRLIYPRTRCFNKYDVHELMATDEEDLSPGKSFNRSATLGFIEFTESGVVVEGDAVIMGNQKIGKIIGFDETHFPNHMNILIKSAKRISGIERRIHPDDVVIFEADRLDS
jgi:hypothetical protein